MKQPVNIPQHIAIVMDGNGRWAKSKGLSKSIGHKTGSKVAEKIAKECQKLGMKHLTLYAFSLENWDRDKKEVAGIMSLLRSYLKKDVNDLVKSGMRISFIGDRSYLPSDIVEIMDKVESSSKEGTFHLILAISYSGRNEIRNAAIKMAEETLKMKKVLEPDSFDKFISTNQLSIPDPDLLIRTSGEYRISNFLLWQIAYSELWFTEKYWPDFTQEDLHTAIIDFSKRERRYGK